MHLPKTRSGKVFLAIASAALITLAMGVAVHLLYPSDWRAVEATVQRVYIKSTRPGTPQWSLFVDARYDVAGESHVTAKDIFRNPSRDVTAAEQANWPPGSKLTIYYDAGDPASTSLVPDGGRQALVATTVILTPLALSILFFIAAIIAGVRANRRR